MPHVQLHWRLTSIACRENIDRQLLKKEGDRDQMQSDVEKITKYDKLRAKARQLRARIAQLREKHEAVRPWPMHVCSDACFRTHILRNSDMSGAGRSNHSLCPCTHVPRFCTVQPLATVYIGYMRVFDRDAVQPVLVLPCSGCSSCTFLLSPPSQVQLPCIVVTATFEGMTLQKIRCTNAAWMDPCSGAQCGRDGAG